VHFCNYLPNGSAPNAINVGSLDSSELAALVASLGTTLTLNELEAALLLLDRNDDGKITFEEFLSWYEGKEDLGADFQV